MDEDGNRSVFEHLLVELDEISAMASELVGDNGDSSEAKLVRERYFRWFAQAIALVPEPMDEKFRDYFEGGGFTPRIRAFLLDPNAPNPLYDPTKQPNPIAPSRFAYSYEHTFLENVEGQRQILLELQHRAPASNAGYSPDGDVFVVHGHDEKTLSEVRRVVAALTSKEPIVLRDRPNRGQTIIEKFENNAATCCFAVVILTADDVGGTARGQLQPRARQNVVFEAGYFVGLLGRHRVVLLFDPRVERPSDLQGIVYVSLEDQWQVKLGQEMRAAEVPVDLNRLAD